MYLQVYQNQALLKNDHQEILAGVKYPMIQEGLVALSGVYQQEDVPEQTQFEIIEKALQRIQKEGWSILVRSKAIEQFLNLHPEYQSLVVTDEQAFLEEKEFVQQENLVQTNDVSSRGKRTLAFGLQIISFLLMLAVLVDMGYAIMMNRTTLLKQVMNTSHLGMSFAMVGLILFTVLSVFWTLTSKKILDDQGQVVKLDRGRGLINFFILAIACGLSFVPLLSAYFSLLFYQPLILASLCLTGVLISLIRLALSRR